MIVTQADILDYLGLQQTATDAQRALIDRLQPNAERKIKTYLGYNVERITDGVEYYEGVAPSPGEPEVSDYIGGKYYRSSGLGGSAILLRNLPVVSITEVRQDAAGYAGQVAGSFGSTTVLVSGTDYYLDLSAAEANGFSMSGLLFRRGSAWPSEHGSVKVKYTSGWTAALIPGDITEAVLYTVSVLWDRSQRLALGGQPASVASATIQGITASYVDDRGSEGLSRYVEDLLASWRREDLLP